MASNPFHVPALEVQRPTVDRLHVRSAEDAHTLFEAVRTGLLRPVIRRLNDAERSAFIRSGSVFIWEESEEATGLRRWTDGLMWSPSRMREPFLFYESNRRSKTSSASSGGGECLSTETTSSSSSLDNVPPSSPVDQSNPGLVKQTYSAIVMGDGSRRKWHLTAYFNNGDYPSLPTIADDHRLRSVVVPRGMYRSGKSRQSARSLQADLGPNASSSDNPYETTESFRDTFESSSASSSPVYEYGPGTRRSSPPSPFSSRPSSSQQTSSSPYQFPRRPSTSWTWDPSQSPPTLARDPLYTQEPSRSHPGPAPLLPPHGGGLLRPLTPQSTFSDQRYISPAQRSVGRSSEDERMLHEPLLPVRDVTSGIKALAMGNPSDSTPYRDFALRPELMSFVMAKASSLQLAWALYTAAEENASSLNRHAWLTANVMKRCRRMLESLDQRLAQPLPEDILAPVRLCQEVYEKVLLEKVLTQLLKITSEERNSRNPGSSDLGYVDNWDLQHHLLKTLGQQIYKACGPSDSHWPIALSTRAKADQLAWICRLSEAILASDTMSGSKSTYGPVSVDQFLGKLLADEAGAWTYSEICRQSLISIITALYSIRGGAGSGPISRGGRAEHKRRPHLRSERPGPVPVEPPRDLAQGLISI